MNKTPKSLRTQIGLFGRTNVGKSSFLNLVSGQDVAITSSVPGTTTDVVEKSLELTPLGPVTFLDTAGINDDSQLGEKRRQRTMGILDRADVAVLITEPGVWKAYERFIVEEARSRRLPLLTVINKTDINQPDPAFLRAVSEHTPQYISCSSLIKEERDRVLIEFKRHLTEILPKGFFDSPRLVGDLMPAGGTAIFVVPIDLEAPKGRLILPQVQSIRDVLDSNALVLVAKETEYPAALAKLKTPPDLVVCDSQAVAGTAAVTPAEVNLTTFSILFARFKFDLSELARGTAAIHDLVPGDRVLIAEACSHHPIEGDIGRVKIPSWLAEFAGFSPKIDVCSGRDYPEDLKFYRLVVHCGGCMLTRKENLLRMRRAVQAGVAVTNYGMCISLTQGLIERVLSPFPASLAAYNGALKERRGIKDVVINE